MKTILFFKENGKQCMSFDNARGISFDDAVHNAFVALSSNCPNGEMFAIVESKTRKTKVTIDGVEMLH